MRKWSRIGKGKLEIRRSRFGALNDDEPYSAAAREAQNPFSFCQYPCIDSPCDYLQAG
jgi:hypothetical protein